MEITQFRNKDVLDEKTLYKKIQYMSTVYKEIWQMSMPMLFNSQNKSFIIF